MQQVHTFIKHGNDNSKLKVLTKDMLSKIRDKLPPQNQKYQNEKTIMVTTRHEALEHLSHILREKYHQRIENDIYLKKVFPEKLIIAFR